jgi:hypothetical protein
MYVGCLGTFCKIGGYFYSSTSRQIVNSCSYFIIIVSLPLLFKEMLFRKEHEVSAYFVLHFASFEDDVGDLFLYAALV